MIRLIAALICIRILWFAIVEYYKYDPIGCIAVIAWFGLILGLILFT